MNLARMAWALVLSVLPISAAFGQPDANEYWDNLHRQKATVAAQVLLETSPRGQHLWLEASKKFGIFSEGEFVPTTVPNLPAKYLLRIRDKTGAPDVSDKDPNDIPEHEKAYIKAFDLAVQYANDIPLERFVESGRDNDWITYGHLLNNPGDWRGHVVPIKGILSRVTKYPAPKVHKDMGIPFLYEAWIKGPRKGATPFVVYFPHLPEGLKPAEKLEVDVEFYGYFLKNHLYTAADKKFYQTPLLVGPTLQLKGALPREEVQVSIPFTVLGVALTMFLGLGLIGLALRWWFQRADAQHELMISKIRQRQIQDEMPMFPPDPEPEVPLALPIDAIEPRDGPPRT